MKTYELPIQASWEIDLFGNLRNAKKGSQATLLQQEAYRQAIRSDLIASIANGYYSLLMLDGQLEISRATLEVWKEQIRVMESKFKVGEETENAVSQARASLHELEATHNDLLRQQREAENALCTLLGTTARSIERGSLEQQTFPERINAGLPVQLLSKRPDVVQAEMTLANAYYVSNQARSAFYPNLTLSGNAGWTNSLGQVVSNPGGWILSAVASLTQPIFNRGKLISNLRVSKDEEQIALLAYKQALLDAGQEVNAMEDSGIIALFWKRDERAISEFENKYKKLCHTVAYGITGNHGSAEECVSDTSLRMWNSIPPEKPVSLKAYAVKIVRNLAISVFRAEHAVKRSAVMVELEECESETAVIDEGGELKEILDDFLETLDRTSARVFLRRYLFSEQVKKIAADLGMSENKVSKILMKTRKNLREYLAERGISV